MIRRHMLCLFLLITFAFPAQKTNRDYHLRHNIKQDGQQFEFHVLDFDDPGVYQYDKSKFYFWLKAQQVHSTQGYSSGLLLHGEFQAFYPNKQLARRGYFYKGLKNGEWLYWNQEGRMILIEHWKSGIKVGLEKKFADDGSLLSQTKYKAGKTVRKTADSVIVTSKNKERITLFGTDGQKLRTIRMKHGKLDGKQQEFKNGKASSISYYKAGEKTEKAEKKKGGKLFEKFRRDKTKDNPRKEEKAGKKQPENPGSKGQGKKRKLFPEKTK